MNTLEQVVIRRAAPDDAPMIARHRARMFHDFVAASEAWTEHALLSGEYLGWFANSKTTPGAIAAGAGVQLRRVPPHPSRPAKGRAFAKGRHGIVLNVFTETEWRNRGVAMLLMEEIISWARTEKLDQLVLHASAQARSLYERMGFTMTNEMRFGGNLGAGDS